MVSSFTDVVRAPRLASGTGLPRLAPSILTRLSDFIHRPFVPGPTSEFRTDVTAHSAIVLTVPKATLG